MNSRATARAALFVAGLAALVKLTGCATAPRPSVDAISGRLSVHVEAFAGQAARQVSAGFELRGNATRGELDLNSPLGSVVARARWQPGSAEWSGPDGREEFPDLAALSTRAFGEPLPVTALFDWLRGRAAAEAPSQPLAGGTGFEQWGWQVDTARLADGQVVARRLAAPVVTLRARMEPAL